MAVIVLDRVGDLVDRLIARCASARIRPERVLIIDPTDLHWTVSWNPLTAPGEPHAVADAFVDSVKRHSESWGIEIDHTLRHVVRALVLNRQSPLEIGRFFSEERFRADLFCRIQDPSLKDFMAVFETLSKEQRLQRQLAIDNKLSRFTANPHLRRLLCGNRTVDFCRIVNDPRAVLLVALRKDRLHGGADLLGDLIVHAIWHAALSRASTPEQFRQRTTLILDEAQNFAGNSLSEIVTEGRRYGLRLVLAHQSQAQLDPSLRSILRNNAAVRMLFNVGPVDAREMAYELTHLSKSEAVEGLLGLRTGEAYVFRRGEAAIKVVTPNVPAECSDLVPAFRERSMRLHAQPVAVVEQEIARRHEMNGRPSALETVSRTEVSHVRLPRR